MILNAQPKQLSLKDDGQIYFQTDPSNPLPGDAVARLVKGETLLQPGLVLSEAGLPAGEDQAAVADHLAIWLKAHIFSVLEPLFALVSDETLPESARGIAYQLFAGTGIVSRSDIEGAIAVLDPEGRQALRNKKVKLGPILVFLPDLNKPAAVRLRALLWSLFNDQPLPAPVPRDGAMSVVIDPTAINPDFYRAIGYPVYGPRAVRIDMLDRVINAVYDAAKDGKFQAQHKQAEWMGCPIADLYGILEAMGHRRIVAEKPPETVPATVPADAISAVAATSPTAEEGASAIAPAAPEVPTVTPKPELDWFFLRRGKAHQEQMSRPPRPEKSAERRPEKDRREFKKKSHKPDPDRQHSRKPRPSPEKEKPQPRIYTAEAKTEDNPFAILQSLKLK